MSVSINRTFQEIGFTHMRILEGVGTIIQLAGLLARLCKMVSYFGYPVHFCLTRVTEHEAYIVSVVVFTLL